MSEPIAPDIYIKIPASTLDLIEQNVEFKSLIERVQRAIYVYEGCLKKITKCCLECANCGSCSAKEAVEIGEAILRGER